MFNVTVLKMKDLIKYLVGMIVTICIILYISKSLLSMRNNNEENKTKLETFSLGSLTSCLDQTIPTLATINEEYNKMENENEKIENKNYLEEFLKTEISSIKGMEKLEKTNKNEKENKDGKKENDTKEEQQNENKNEILLASTEGIKTEVVTQNPISESYNVQYGKVKIKNQTTYELTEEMLTTNINIENKNVLIFHTHSCESYTPS